MKGVGIIGFSDVVTFKQKEVCVGGFCYVGISGKGFLGGGNRTNKAQSSERQADQGAGGTEMQGRRRVMRARD